jgi:hypothetical protein
LCQVVALAQCVDAQHAGFTVRRLERRELAVDQAGWKQVGAGAGSYAGQRMRLVDLEKDEAQAG